MKTPNGRKQVNATFGVPYTASMALNETWKEANLTTVALPKGMLMYAAWDNSIKVDHIYIHRLLADNLSKVLTEIWATARFKVKQAHGFDKTTGYYDGMTRKFLANLGLDQFGGTFNFRAIRGKKALSMHSYGIAIDLDPAHNALGAKVGRMPKWVVAIFEKHGWFWGGKFKRRKDWQHFQFATGC
jgi:hypothetical protein